MAKLGDGGEYNPMTSPTQRAGADVQRYFPVPRNATMLKLDGEVSGGYVAADDHEKAVAALQARIAELEARNAASERDAGRYRVVRAWIVRVVRAWIVDGGSRFVINPDAHITFTTPEMVDSWADAALQSTDRQEPTP